MVNECPRDTGWQSRRPALSRIVLVLVVVLLAIVLFAAAVMAAKSRDPFGRYGDGDGQFHLPKGMATSSVINYYEDFTSATGWETSGCAAGQGLWKKTSTHPQGVTGVTGQVYWYAKQPALDFKADKGPPPVCPPPPIPCPCGAGPCPGLDAPCYRCKCFGYWKTQYRSGDLCAYNGDQHCGNLISPRINLHNVSSPITLTFRSCLEAPQNAVAWVEVSVNSGEFFPLKVIEKKDGCEDVKIDLSGFGHSIIQLRFFIIVVQTSSYATNQYGWVVDNVRVRGGIGTDVGPATFTPPHRVYVADTGNHRIQVFDADGNFQSEFGQYYDVPGTFNSPSSVAVSALQLREAPEQSFFYIYVGDTGNHRIQVFKVIPNADGEVDEWGFYGDLEGQFHLPEGIALDPIEPQFPNKQPPKYQNDTTPENWTAHLYVADMGNHRVQYFTQEGTFVGQFGVYGTGTTEFNRPQDVGVGIRLDQVSTTAQRLVDVYVADTGNHRIQYFDGTGSYINEFGRYGIGSDPEQFNSPAGVAVDRLPPAQYPDAVGLEGDVFIMDTGNHRGQCLDTRP